VYRTYNNAFKQPFLHIFLNKEDSMGMKVVFP